MNSHSILSKRRRFDETFKQQAVQMLIESGNSVTAIAAGLGIDRTNLQKWKKQLAPACAPEAPAGGDSTIGANEFLQLRREVETIKEAVTHLRKVVYKSLCEKYGGGR